MMMMMIIIIIMDGNSRKVLCIKYITKKRDMKRPRVNRKESAAGHASQIEAT